MGTDNGDKESGFLFKDLTREVIGAAFDVHNALGCGLLEKVYENALVCELESRGKTVETQKEYPVTYRHRNVGIYYADLVVDDKVIVEVKAVESLSDAHRAQLINYLKISGLRVGLLLNFAKPRLEYKRFIL